MRLTRHSSPSSRRTISRANAGESFIPPKQMYSNEHRRWWVKSYWRSRSMVSCSGMAFSAGMRLNRCSWSGECMEMATWQGLSSRNLLSFPRTPTELTVMRFGLQANPQSAVMMLQTPNTASRLSIGSPCPIKTMFVSFSISGNAMIWFKMSATVRLPCHPCLPV